MQELDLIIYGATGSVGRLAVQDFAKTYPHIRLGIAGRDRAKLDKLAASLPQPTPIFLAHADDADALSRMIRQTRVVSNFAGPFARYAPLLIALCAAEGRHYCDITGETGFVREMIDQHQGTAQASGSLLIPMAGFDSVPAELLVHRATQTAQSKGEPWSRLTHYYKIRGGFNGGTLASALLAAETPSPHKLMHPNLLISDSSWPKPNRRPMAPRYDAEVGRWTSVFFMQPVNAAVIRRSQFLKGLRECAQCSYEERMVWQKGWKGGLQATVTTGALAAFAGLSATNLGRKALAKVGPAPGEMPSETIRARSFYKGTLYAEAKSGRKATFSMEADMDPGNEFTALAANEVARLLTEREPEPGAGGFSTVSHAFGDALIERLKTRGVRFS